MVIDLLRVTTIVFVRSFHDKLAQGTITPYHCHHQHVIGLDMGVYHDLECLGSQKHCAAERCPGDRLPQARQSLRQIAIWRNTGHRFA